MSRDVVLGTTDPAAAGAGLGSPGRVAAEAIAAAEEALARSAAIVTEKWLPSPDADRRDSVDADRLDSVEFAAPSGYVRLHQDRAQAASRAPSGPRFAQRTPTRDRIKPSRERRAASAGRAEGKVHRAGPKFAS